MSLASHFASSSDALLTWLAHTTGAEKRQISLMMCVLAMIFALMWYWRIFRSEKRYGMTPPGPVGIPLLGHVPFMVKRPNLHVYFDGLASKYGPVLKVKLGSKAVIVVSSPSATREILKEQDSTFAYRDVPSGGKAMYEGKQMVWTPYGPEWRLLRKASAHKLLGNTAIDTNYWIRKREYRTTVQHLYKRAGTPVKVWEEMFVTVSNIIQSLMWGGCLQGEERKTITAQFTHVVAEMTSIMGKPNVSDFFPGLAKFDLQGIAKNMRGIFKQVDRIYDTVIDRRLSMEKDGGATGKGGYEDFVQYLLKLKDDETGERSLSMIGLKALLMSMVVGGTETSAQTVEFVMSEVINNPHVLAKIREELDIVVGNDKIVEDVHVGKLPYIHAVLKESLRLHPPVPLLIPHSPIKDTIVSGYTIPKGSRVYFNVWAIHRDPTLWEKPTEFIPERFLSGKEARDYHGNDFAYLPFGAGRRICPGLQMAEKSLIYAIATLLHSFDWKLPDGEKKVDMSGHLFGLVMEKKQPLVAIPTPRLSDPSLYQ